MTLIDGKRGYSLCPHCRSIVDNSGSQMQCLDFPCPICGKVRSAEQLPTGWPDIPTQLMIDFCCDHELTSYKEQLVVVVLACTTAEMLLERLNARLLMPPYRIAAKHFEIITNSFEGRQRMLELFKKLANRSFAEVLTEIAESGFYGEWDRLAKIRNKFLHGNLIVGDIDFPDFRAVLEQFRHALGPTFVKVNNQLFATPKGREDFPEASDRGQ